MRDLCIEFAGGREAIAPFTWAQHGMWGAIQRNPPGHFNIGRELEVDPPRAVHAVTRAVRQLVLRHEALRTLVRVRDGVPEQIVIGAGRLHARVVESDPAVAAAASEELYEQLRAEAFDLAELPLRVGVVTARGLVRRIVLVYSHLSVDGRSGQILAHDLRRLLVPGTTLEEPGPQPVDLAEEQHTDDGRRTRVAIRFWTSQYRRIPPATLAPAGPAHTPPYQRAVLVSSALRLATALVAARHRVSTSTVLLAAAAALVGEHTGHECVAISIVASNRLRRRYKQMVGMLAQLGLFVLDLPQERSFDDVVRRSARSAVRAFGRASYDQAALDRALGQVADDRGVDVNPYCCFNDVRSAVSDEVAADGGIRDAEPASREVLSAAAARTTLFWRPDPGPARCRFCLVVLDITAGELGLMLTADTRCLPPAGIEAFLRGMEGLIIEAAHDDVPLGQWWSRAGWDGYVQGRTMRS